jgi:protease II
LRLDYTKLKNALDFIKDNPSFTIKVGINESNEYVLVVLNRVNDVEIRVIISEEANADFETYCKNIL